MKKNNKILIALFWIFTVLVCSFIFYMSSCDATDSQEMSSGIGAWMANIFGYKFTDFFVRKCAHTLEYMALGFFAFGAVGLTFGFKKRNFLFSLLGCMLYASSDEIHQLFVAGRSCQLRDVLIDTAGALGGILIMLFIAYIVNRHNKKKSEKAKD